MDTLKMQYKIAGNGSNTLVLVPGGLTGWVSWDPFIPWFATSNKVVQLQLLNVQHGLEDKELPATYSVKTESGALAESMKELGINSPVDYIGWSYGSFALLDFALDHPHLVRSLTLIEPPAFWMLASRGSLTSETKRIMEFMKTFSGEISEKKLEEFLLTVGFVAPGTSLHDHPQWNTWVNYRESLRNGEAVVMHTDDISRLQNFNQPVLLVKGRGSAPFLHEIIDLLEHDLPNARTVELVGGHAPHIVAKNQFLEIWETFRENN